MPNVIESKNPGVEAKPCVKAVKTPADVHAMAARPADSPIDTVAKQISDSSFLQIVNVAASFSGIVSSVLGVLSFIESEEQPSNATILSAIQQLETTLQNDFVALGDLIAQQTQLITGTIDRDVTALAVSNSKTAMNRVQEFLSDNNRNALEDAKTTSSQGLNYFTSFNLTGPADLAFLMPGLTTAGTARIFTFAAQPIGAREPYSVVVNDLTSMVNLMGGMVNAITSTVNANHSISVKSHITQCPVHTQIEGASGPALGQPHRNVTVIDGYYHVEAGLELAFFDAQQGTLPCEQPSPYEAAAAAAAQAARIQGVNDELALLGIPQFAQTLQSWTTLLNTVSATVMPTVFV